MCFQSKFYIIFVRIFQGFINWGRREFNQFIAAVKKYGKNDLYNICRNVPGTIISNEFARKIRKDFKETGKEIFEGNGFLSVLIFFKFSSNLPILFMDFVLTRVILISQKFCLIVFQTLFAFLIFIFNKFTGTFYFLLISPSFLQRL